MLERHDLSQKQKLYLAKAELNQQESLAPIDAYTTASSGLNKRADGGDREFLNTVVLTRDAFDNLARRFSQYYVVRLGPGRSGRPSRLADKRSVLGLLLHYYASTSERKTLCELFGCPPSTTSRVLLNAEKALEKALAEMPESAIRWPSEKEQKQWVAWIAEREPLVTKKFGFIGGKNYRVVQPSHPNLQNANVQRLAALCPRYR
ncbi:hypothetical protein PsorP6_008347 [Peronosclerospora sorghi]|uniref:Uncharacterized protein n=1 Tax=Peronosclerospora sorghi TaxID=230839 RepID=A0ACC0WBJ7_9STRA|nr:hypothetical protein PsorP6_008347 [Peronosclerospora sorghi]